MRKELEKINSERTRFAAIFVRYGAKPGWTGYPIKTILLKNVNNGESMVTDHIWFTMTKGFEALGELKEGDHIEFSARVKEYAKGYVNTREDIDESEIDYKLSHPTKIIALGNNLPDWARNCESKTCTHRGLRQR